MIFRIYHITCDGDGCSEAVEVEALDGALNQTDAFRRARLEGWSIGRRHLCPTCQSRIRK